MAWATHMPYIDKEKELVSYTNCKTMDNGWMWNIPLWSKIGTGYVYSNKFVTDEGALQEFKEQIRKTGRDPEILEYKKIPIRNGIHEKIWEKNVVAIGLAAGFIEPLESTGLWFTHEFAYSLLRILFRQAHASQFEQDMFNKQCDIIWNQTVDFVALHYALSSRGDTPYWKSIKSVKYNISENFIHASFDVGRRWFSDWPGINCITLGFEYHFFDETYFWTHAYPKNIKVLQDNTHTQLGLLDVQRQKWVQEIENEPSFFEALRKIHEE